MVHTGQDLGADLFELWKAGKVFLPQVAEVYLQANGTVADTSKEDTAAFSRPVPDYRRGGFNDQSGQVYPHWQALRDRFQEILGKTAANLVGQGEALMTIVKMYADADEEARRALENAIADRADNPNLAPPHEEQLPSPRMPGD